MATDPFPAPIAGASIDRIGQTLRAAADRAFVSSRGRAAERLAGELAGDHAPPPGRRLLEVPARRG
jgi:hypothetical protein